MPITEERRAWLREQDRKRAEKHAARRAATAADRQAAKEARDRAIAAANAELTAARAKLAAFDRASAKRRKLVDAVRAARQAVLEASAPKPAPSRGETLRRLRAGQ